MSDNDILPTVLDLFSFLNARQSGKEWRCVCPVHGSRNGKSRTLSMKIGDEHPVIFYCHKGCTFAEITAELERQSMWPVQWDPEHQPVGDTEQDAADARRWARVLRIDSELVSAKGSPVERYLRSRGITLLPELEIQYHPLLRHDLDGTHWPAMVAAVRDVDNKVLGLLRTYLRYDRPGKAPVDPPKLSLGFMSGCAVHLAPAGPTLIVGEGIETVLSVMQDTRLPGWATLGATNMSKVDLPEIVKEVVIAADGDAAGEYAALRAGTKWKRQGKRVRIMRPPEGFDFNDVLRGLTS